MGDVDGDGDDKFLSIDFSLSVFDGYVQEESLCMQDVYGQRWDEIGESVVTCLSWHDEFALSLVAGHMYCDGGMCNLLYVQTLMFSQFSHFLVDIGAQPAAIVPEMQLLKCISFLATFV
jgi:hypothetical protein